MSHASDPPCEPAADGSSAPLDKAAGSLELAFLSASSVSLEDGYAAPLARDGTRSKTKAIRPTLGSVICGVTCVIIAFVWQLLIVNYSSDGNWTVLFNTGNSPPAPSELSAERIQKTGTGYDGQFYHYVAHDPFMRNAWREHFDFYTLRYARALVPLLAYAAALGRAEWIDTAYIAVVLLFVGFGGYWLSVYAVNHGHGAEKGLLFLLLPATIVSVENMTVDVALCALCAAYFAYQWTGIRTLPFLVMAPLIRETGAVLLVASGAAALVRRRWNRILIVFAAAAPWVAWLAFVRLKAGPVDYPGQILPLSGTLQAIRFALERVVHNQETRLPAFLDVLAIGGAVVAIALGLFRLNSPRVEKNIACGVFALVAVVQQHPDTWVNYHAFGRILSPLLLWLGMLGISEQKYFLFVPALLMLPRLLFPLFARILQILAN